MDIRVGFGIDIHRFDKDKDSIILGGYKVPCRYGILAHSDGDLVLHALVDAILGAIAKGDIGSHFPPSDEKWRSADSRIFLQEALRLLKEEKFQISNIDITILGEMPKINPIRDNIRQSVSELVEIDLNRVSVKATTTEKMGFTGREEGLVAMVNILIFNA